MLRTLWHVRGGSLVDELLERVRNCPHETLALGYARLAAIAAADDSCSSRDRRTVRALLRTGLDSDLPVRLLSGRHRNRPGPDHGHPGDPAQHRPAQAGHLPQSVAPSGSLCESGRVRPSLYDHAGGEPAFVALATAHHARCLADPELNHPFSHADGNPRHVRRLAAYWAEVLGGPPQFSELCDDQAGVVHLHAGNGDMTDLGRRFVECFVQAVDDAGLPADPEFRAAMRAYMEWAVADMLSYSDDEAEALTTLPLPHWSWDGLRR